MKKLTLIAFTTALLIGFATAEAQDSPQFRGPNRDGKYPATGLLKSWPDGGPPLLWTADGLGMGYASPSVVGDRIYVPGQDDAGDGYLHILDTDGNLLNSILYGPETHDKQAPGSRSTPTIEGNRAYVLSGMGLLSCIDVDKGEPIWQVDILKRFDGKQIQWTLAESLQIYGDMLICTPGGPDASVAALNKMTGETIWVSEGLSEQSAYCAPDIFNHNGRDILVTMTAKHVVGIDPKSGELLWQHEHETDYDIHAVTPVYQDGMIYYTAGYGSGGGMIQLSEDGTSVTPKWTDKTLDCQHHGVVLLDGYIYGTSHKGRELVCLELATGKVMWQTRDVRQGVVVYADGMLYCYEGPKTGIVSLVKAQPSGFERTGQFEMTVGSSNHWAHPVIANGRLYMRRDEFLQAYDIAAK